MWAHAFVTINRKIHLLVYVVVGVRAPPHHVEVQNAIGHSGKLPLVGIEMAPGRPHPAEAYTCHVVDNDINIYSVTKKTNKINLMKHKNKKKQVRLS